MLFRGMMGVPWYGAGACGHAYGSQKKWQMEMEDAKSLKLLIRPLAFAVLIKNANRGICGRAAEAPPRLAE